MSERNRNIFFQNQSIAEVYRYTNRKKSNMKTNREIRNLVLIMALTLIQVAKCQPQESKRIWIEGINDNPECTTTGRDIWRSESPSPTRKVHGQIGCTNAQDWPAESGQVCYKFNIAQAGTKNAEVTVWYSKHSDQAEVCVLINGHEKKVTLKSTGSWNIFGTFCLEFPPLTKGQNILTFRVEGLRYGVFEIGRIQINF